MSSPTEGYSQSKIDAIVDEYEKREKEKERKLNYEKYLYATESREWDEYEQRENEHKQKGKEYLDDELNKRKDDKINKSPKYKEYLRFYNSHLGEQKGVDYPIVPTYDDYSNYKNAIYFYENRGKITHPENKYYPMKEIEKFKEKFDGEDYQAKTREAFLIQQEEARKLAQEQQEQKDLEALKALKLAKEKKSWFWGSGSKKRKTKSRNKKRKSKTRKYK
jgi:hypothetical protein